jgi:hypothetical protein
MTVLSMSRCGTTAYALSGRHQSKHELSGPNDLQIPHDTAYIQTLRAAEGHSRGNEVGLALDHEDYNGN